MRTPCLQTLCTALATFVLHSCSPAPAYAAAPLTLRYTSKAESTSPYQTTIWQGETVDLQCTLTAYGSPLTLAPDAAASLWYQTNGMASAWWQGPATATTNGVLTAHWSPSLDVGATAYTYFIGVGDSATNTLYRSYGIIRMGKSPGYVPNALPLPRHSIDFATLDILNAPWATPEEVTNIVEAIGGGIGEESDPIAYPVAVEALYKANSITLEGLGGLTNTTPIINSSMRVHGNLPRITMARTTGTTGSFVEFQTSKFFHGTSSSSKEILYAPNDGTMATEEYTDGTVAYHNTSASAHAGLLTKFATTNWVESIRGIHADIASNIVYHVVVSNGHWLIQEVQ